jgi:hypothetical protein
MEQELLTHLDHLSSSPVFSGVRVARSNQNFWRVENIFIFILIYKVEKYIDTLLIITRY